MRVEDELHARRRRGQAGIQRVELRRLPRQGELSRARMRFDRQPRAHNRVFCHLVNARRPTVAVVGGNEQRRVAPEFSKCRNIGQHKGAPEIAASTTARPNGS